MRRLHTRREGMTLIELMIVVAIIGILAATAIPAFSSYQNRSRRAGGDDKLSAISRCELAYFGTNGIYLGGNPMPGGGLSAAKRAWDAASQAEYGPLGYAPEGAVYYDYEVNTVPSDCTCGIGDNGEASCFTATAYGDVDGDSGVAVIAYFNSDKGGNWCSTGTGLPPRSTSAPAGRRSTDRMRSAPGRTPTTTER